MLTPTGYSHTQVGSQQLIVTTGICVFLGILALVIRGMGDESADEEMDGPLHLGITVRTPQQRRSAFGILLIVLVTVLGAGLYFSLMTVSVRDDTLSWSFAFGFGQHHVPVSEITKAGTERNTAIEGIGVHETASGTLYNVSGDGAVDVRLEDGSWVRLGTDQPDSLLAAIQSAMK